MILRSTDVRSALKRRQRGFILDPFKFGGGGGGDPLFANVQLLLHMDGANGSTTFTDHSSNAYTITVNGGITVTTAQSKFGGASGEFPGVSGDYLTGTLSPGFNPRTSAFCIEVWKRFPNTSSSQAFFTKPGTAFYWVYLNPSLYLGDGSINTLASGLSITPGQWYHLAVSFDGTTYRNFMDGVLLQSSTTLLASTTVTAFDIGRWSGGGVTSIGQMDDFRLTVGNARYTAGFTPPAAAHPNF